MPHSYKSRFALIFCVQNLWNFATCQIILSIGHRRLVGGHNEALTSLPARGTTLWSPPNYTLTLYVARTVTRNTNPTALGVPYDYNKAVREL